MFSFDPSENIKPKFLKYFHRDKKKKKKKKSKEKSYKSVWHHDWLTKEKSNIRKVLSTSPINSDLPNKLQKQIKVLNYQLLFIDKLLTFRK